MRPTITTLILAHLAASSVIACRAEDPSGKTVTVTVPPPATATATPTPTATPTATATATPTPTATVACGKGGACPPGLECVLPFDGNHVIPGPGTCMPPGPRMGGRPLVVDGVAHVSAAAGTSTWLEGEGLADAVREIEPATRLAWRDTLARAAFEEHASVPAFARTLCQLVALGAPSWLVEKTQRALADEIVHARRTFAWAGALGGEAVGPGTLLEAVAPFPGSSTLEGLAAELLRDVFRGGCIGETLAAHDAHEKSLTAPLAELRAYYTGIAADEARHAALAFETVLWLVATFPALRSALDEERIALGSAAPGDRAIVEPLIATVLA